VIHFEDVTKISGLETLSQSVVISQTRFSLETAVLLVMLLVRFLIYSLLYMFVCLTEEWKPEVSLKDPYWSPTSPTADDNLIVSTESEDMRYGRSEFH